MTTNETQDHHCPKHPHVTLRCAACAGEKASVTPARRRQARINGRLSNGRPPRLTEAQVNDIRTMLQAGMRQREIAAAVGCSTSMVSLVARGKRRVAR